MKISTKGRYALEAMIELASYPEAQYVSIREIAQKRQCSIKYLEQLFQPLKKQGILASTRGKDGGYCLAKCAEDITARDIIMAVEGALEPVGCITKPCPRDHTCKAKPIWIGLQQVIFEVLDEKSLKDLAQFYSEVRK